MKTADRQKMCPNCDSKIPFEISQCPHCFTAVPTESGIQTTILKSSYTPPYSPKPLFSDKPKEEKKSLQEQTESKEERASEPLKKTFLPILLLSLAGNLFTLGLLQFFFSEEGVVKLELNATYWFIFLLAAVPLFYWGSNLLKKE